MSWHNSSTDPERPWSLDAVLPDGARQPGPTSPADDEPHPVDQIAIRKLGGFNMITPAQWQALDRDHRMTLIRDGLVTFLHQGEDVPVKAALLGLRAGTKAGEASESQSESSVDASGPATTASEPRPMTTEVEPAVTAPDSSDPAVPPTTPGGPVAPAQLIGGAELLPPAPDVPADVAGNGATSSMAAPTGSGSAATDLPPWPPPERPARPPAPPPEDDPVAVTGETAAVGDTTAEPPPSDEPSSNP